MTIKESTAVECYHHKHHKMPATIKKTELSPQQGKPDNEIASEIKKAKPSSITKSKVKAPVSAKTMLTTANTDLEDSINRVIAAKDLDKLLELMDVANVDQLRIAAPSVHTDGTFEDLLATIEISESDITISEDGSRLRFSGSQKRGVVKDNDFLTMLAHNFNDLYTEYHGNGKDDDDDDEEEGEGEGEGESSEDSGIEVGFDIENHTDYDISTLFDNPYVERLERLDTTAFYLGPVMRNHGTTLVEAVTTRPSPGDISRIVFKSNSSVTFILSRSVKQKLKHGIMLSLYIKSASDEDYNFDLEMSTKALSSMIVAGTHRMTTM